MVIQLRAPLAGAAARLIVQFQSYDGASRLPHLAEALSGEMGGRPPLGRDREPSGQASSEKGVNELADFGCD